MKDLKGLYTIVEGPTDVEILKVLLNFESFNTVYMIPASGYHNIPSLVRTLRLMKDKQASNYKFLVVFDSDSNDDTVTEEKVSTMKYLTKADYDSRIGVFAFQPNIEVFLGFEGKYNKRGLTNLIKYINDNIDVLREKEKLKEIQRFLDTDD